MLPSDWFHRIGSIEVSHPEGVLEGSAADFPALCPVEFGVVPIDDYLIGFAVADGLSCHGVDMLLRLSLESGRIDASIVCPVEVRMSYRSDSQ